MEVINQELLKKLQKLREKIVRLSDLYNQQINIVEQYRSYEFSLIEEKKHFGDTKSTLKTILKAASLVVGFFLAIISIVNSELFFYAIVCFIAFFYLQQSKNELTLKSWKTIIISLYLAYSIFIFFDILRTSTALGKALAIFLLVIATVGIRVVTRFQNGKIRNQNQRHSQKYEEIQAINQRLDADYQHNRNLCQQAKDDMLTFGDGWYPQDYYSIPAINFFINAVQNLKGNNIPELVRLFDNYVASNQKEREDERRHRELLNDQIRTREELKISMEANRHEIRKGNLIMFAGFATLANIGQGIYTNTQAIYKNTKKPDDNSLF